MSIIKYSDMVINNNTSSVTSVNGFMSLQNFQNNLISDKLYLEMKLDSYSITNTSNYVLELIRLYYINNSVIYIISIGYVSNNTRLIISYYKNSTWTTYKEVNNTSYTIKASNTGLGIDYSTGYVYFYINGTSIASVKASDYVSLYNFNSVISIANTNVNFSVTPHYYRNDCYFIPSGYSVPGDLLPKEAIKDKEEYYYTYK